MARRPKAHLIKTNLVYTVWDAAEALGCHRQTVIRWIKDKGLVADHSKKPWLITGRDLKSFLGHRDAQRRSKMALYHLYCFVCKAPREPAEKMADYTHDFPMSGMLKALCPECCCMMNKRIRRADLEGIRGKVEVTIKQADPRLVSRTDPFKNVTFNDGEKTNATAQQR